jgi:stage II sporulation protein D
LRIFITAVFIVFLSFTPALSQTIKVLIIDESFEKLPAEDEKLAMLDRINGNLILGYNSYNGQIEVWKGMNGLYLINELDLEDYVEGVVKAETGKDWAMEALKAQAVVVRTYVLHQKQRSGGKKFHVTSTVLDQLYKGENTDSSVSSAVAETSGEILTYNGEPIAAFYHSTSGGKTELPEEAFGQSYPYLTSVSSNCKLSPYSSWVRRIPLKEIEKATGVENLKDISIASHTKTGRVKEIVLLSNPESKTIKATEFRKLLGWKRLPSTDFTLKLDGEMVDFEGKGYGHGVGLCQWSALEMALEGKTYKEILAHFYPGATLERYDEGQ